MREATIALSAPLQTQGTSPPESASSRHVDYIGAPGLFAFFDGGFATDGL